MIKVMKKKYTRQQCKKQYDKECFVCKESNYDLLDAHRIIEQGTYHPINVVTLCANCHRRAHAGVIQFVKKHLSTAGHHVLHWVKNGEELWSRC